MQNIGRTIKDFMSLSGKLEREIEEIVRRSGIVVSIDDELTIRVNTHCSIIIGYELQKVIDYMYELDDELRFVLFRIIPEGSKEYSNSGDIIWEFAPSDVVGKSKSDSNETLKYYKKLNYYSVLDENQERKYLASTLSPKEMDEALKEFDKANEEYGDYFSIPRMIDFLRYDLGLDVQEIKFIDLG